MPPRRNGVGSVHSDRANPAAHVSNVEQNPIFDGMLPFLRECDIDGAVLAAMELFAAGSESVGVGLPAPLPFLSFGFHAAHTQDRSRMQMDAVLASLEANDLDEASRALGQLIDIHTEELEWLDNHPPEDCYRRLYEDYRSVTEAWTSAMGLWRQGLLGSDPGLFQRGTEELTVAGESLKQITASFERVALDCRAGSATPGPSPSPSSSANERVPSP